MSRVYRSFAKVNLHLQVVGRRADGYHELRTLFQTIALHDLVEVELEGLPPGVGKRISPERVKVVPAR